MAPLPVENTARLFVDYITCGVNHTSMIRFDAPNTYADAQIEWNDVVEAYDANLYLLTIVGARVSDNGSTVSYAVPWTQQATYGTDDGPPEAGAYMVNFIGRSVGGRRAAFELFGARTEQVDGKYRIFGASNAATAAAIAELEAAEGTALAIDGTQPIWQQYANLGPNAYWRNKIR